MFIPSQFQLNDLMIKTFLIDVLYKENIASYRHIILPDNNHMYAVIMHCNWVGVPGPGDF